MPDSTKKMTPKAIATVAAMAATKTASNEVPSLYPSVRHCLLSDFRCGVLMLFELDPPQQLNASHNGAVA